MRHPTLQRLYALETFGIKLGLENISRLCAALDHPERAFRSLLIAGTNGKGSVTAMVHAGLMAAGVRAARYTSPHLSDLSERFVMGRSAVAADRLIAAAADVLDVAERLVASGELPAPPTFFEATTAVAFELFRRAGIEVAVLEVGLGGRFDATNVVSPAATAITSIGLDHQQQLGNSLASIAFEKAGIIKTGVPVVMGRLPAEGEAVIREVAHARGAPLIAADDDVQANVTMQDGLTTMEMTTPNGRYGPLRLALRGEHQVANALVALRLMETAAGVGGSLSREAIARGLSEAEWPARLELISLPGDRGVLLDAAHNPDGAAALASYLRRWHPEPLPLVFGAMRDKDVSGILRPLLPLASRVIVTAAPTPRAADPAALASEVTALAPGTDVAIEPDPLEAVRRGLGAARLVVVAGSIFLVGAVRGPLLDRAILH